MSLDLKTYSAHFDRGASRLLEALWIVCRFALFMPSFPLPSLLRVGILRLFGAKVGNGVVIRSGVNITFPWRLKIGDYVWLGEQAMILNLAAVEIDSNCCISQRAFLCTGSHDFRSPGFDLITKPIHIGEGSWISAQVFVGPGVNFGPNSMACAGSVVLSDVPARSIVRGNPAAVIKTICEE